MDNVTTVEMEQQQRGQTFSQALRRLEKEYNCTVTNVPKWMPLIGGTFVLSFDEQVMVGPVPEEEIGETEKQSGPR